VTPPRAPRRGGWVRGAAEFVFPAGRSHDAVGPRPTERVAWYATSRDAFRPRLAGVSNRGTAKRRDSGSETRAFRVVGGLWTRPDACAPSLALRAVISEISTYRRFQEICSGARQQGVVGVGWRVRRGVAPTRHQSIKEGDTHKARSFQRSKVGMLPRYTHARTRMPRSNFLWPAALTSVRPRARSSHCEGQP